MALEVGSEAPDFTLKDQNNQEVTLSSFRGGQSAREVGLHPADPLLVGVAVEAEPAR